MCIDNMLYVRIYAYARENTSGIRPADHSVRETDTTVIICIVNTQLTKYVRRDTRTHRVICKY